MFTGIYRVSIRKSLSEFKFMGIACLIPEIPVIFKKPHSHFHCNICGEFDFQGYYGDIPHQLQGNHLLTMGNHAIMKVKGHLKPELFNHEVFTSGLFNHEFLNHGVEKSWLKSLVLKSPGLKCHLSIKLKDISTSDFSTPEFSTP